MGKPIQIENDYQTDFDRQLKASGLIPETGGDKNLLPTFDKSELGNLYSNIDIEPYKGNVPNVSLPYKTDSENKAFLDKTYRQIKADQQGTMSKAFNSIVGGGLAGVLGGLENISLIPQSFTDDFTKNPVAQIFADMKQYVNENTPIYAQDDATGLSEINEGADVWQGLKSVIDSAVSFGVPGGAIVKGTSYLTKLGRMMRPTRLGTALSQKGIAANVYNKSNAFLNKAMNSQSFQELAKAGFAGVVSNQLEGTVMAIEMYDNIMKDLSSQGVDEETAREIAQSRANEMEEMNRGLLVSNMFQLHGLSKAMAGTRNIMTAPGMLNSMKASLSLKTPSNNIFIQNLGEAAEEMIQSSVQQSLETLAKKDAKLIDSTKDKYELIQDYLFSDQALYEGALGFFGGAFQRGISGITANIGDKSKAQKRYDEQQTSMQETSALMASQIKDFGKAELLRQKAQQTNDPDFEKLVGDVQFLNLAATSFEMGTTGHLEGILDDISKSDNKEEAATAISLKARLLGWEKKYVEVADITPNTREAFMLNIQQDLLHEQLALAESRKKDTVNSFKNKVNNIAKSKKVVVDSFGTIKEDTLDKHITIDENGNIKYSDFLKTSNPTTQQALSDVESQATFLYQDISKELENVNLLNQHLDTSNQKLQYALSPERLQEIAKVEQDKALVSQAKAKVNSKNVKQVEKELEDSGIQDAEVTKGSKLQRKSKIEQEVKSKEITKEEVTDDSSRLKRISKNKTMVEENGEVKVVKDTTPTNVNQREVTDSKGIKIKIENVGDDVKPDWRYLNEEGKPSFRKYKGEVTKEEAPKKTVKETTREDVPKEKLQQPTIDELNRLNIIPDIVDVGYNKIAYASSEFEEVIKNNSLDRVDILDENGKITLNPEYIYVLHPDHMLPGTEITLRVAPNPNDIMVYDDGVKISYKDWKNKNPESNEKIPIEIVSNGLVVGYVHEPSWINYKNVQGESISIDEQIELLNAIREVVIDRGEIKTKIESKSYGKFLTKTPDTIKNNTPNSIVAVFNKNVLTNQSDGTAISDIDIVNMDKLTSGTTYNLIRLQSNKYFASSVRHSKASEEIVTTVTQAIRAYVKGEETEATKLIAKNLGYDILEAAGLSNYLKLFVPVKNVSQAYEISLDNLIDDTYNYINNSDANTPITHRPFIIVEKGNVIFGMEGTKKDTINYVTKGSKNIDDYLTAFEKYLANSFINVSIEGFGKTPILIDKEGNPNTPYKDYTDYAKSNIQTNLYSINIGDTDIYLTQPVIRYDDSFKDKPKVKKAKVVKPKVDTLENLEKERLSRQEEVIKRREATIKEARDEFNKSKEEGKKNIDSRGLQTLETLQKKELDAIDVEINERIKKILPIELKLKVLEWLKNQVNQNFEYKGGDILSLKTKKYLTNVLGKELAGISIQKLIKEGSIIPKEEGLYSDINGKNIGNSFSVMTSSQVNKENFLKLIESNINDLKGKPVKETKVESLNEIEKIVITEENYNNWSNVKDKTDYDSFVDQVKSTLNSFDKVKDKSLLTKENIDSMLKDIKAFKNKVIRDKVISLVIDKYSKVEQPIATEKGEVAQIFESLVKSVGDASYNLILQEIDKAGKHIIRNVVTKATPTQRAKLLSDFEKLKFNRPDLDLQLIEEGNDWIIIPKKNIVVKEEIKYDSTVKTSLNSFPVERWFIPESIAKKAYEEYVKLYGSRQSFEQIKNRGGFSRSEMNELYPGWGTASIELQSLEKVKETPKQEVSDAKADIEKLKNTTGLSINNINLDNPLLDLNAEQQQRIAESERNNYYAHFVGTVIGNLQMVKKFLELSRNNVKTPQGFESWERRAEKLLNETNRDYNKLVESYIKAGLDTNDKLIINIGNLLKGTTITLKESQVPETTKEVSKEDDTTYIEQLKEQGIDLDALPDDFDFSPKSTTTNELTNILEKLDGGC